jgi:hypothetical protein
MANMTQHAACRMQQRGIKAETIEILFVSGAREHDHQGATILYFDKPARQRLRHEYGSDRYRKIEGQLNAYAVVAEDGSIVTVGHRTKRINRH